MEINTNKLDSQSKREIFYLILSTLLLRIGFAGSILLFDWTLIWGIEKAFGIAETSSVTSILLTSFAAITYLIAEIMFTGYYGNKSDRIGSKPVILYATLGAAIVLLFYGPAAYLFEFSLRIDPIFAIIMLTGYLAIVHFLHGVYASAEVAPTLGFINSLSSIENRTLHMSYFDNAILYGRAGGMIIGGFLWILFQVDKAPTFNEQATRIMFIAPVFTLLLIIAWALIKFGMRNPPPVGGSKKFSMKKDVAIAFRVMLSKERRPLLMPWVLIAALIGSASLWGPSVAFRIASASSSTHEERGLNALLPIMIALIGLALPAPLWGKYADHHGKKKTLKIGLFGLPIAAVLGLAAGYPFYKNELLGDASLIHHIPFLLSLLPAAFMFSAFIPVLMGSLGETAEQDNNGTVMSGYHFVIASGEIVGILGGGLFISIFALIGTLGIFSNVDMAILIGFVLFELLLVIGMIVGILKLPQRNAQN